MVFPQHNMFQVKLRTGVVKVIFFGVVNIQNDDTFCFVY